MWNAVIALLVCWAVAGGTLGVTWADISITVLSTPVDVTDTVVVVEDCVFNTDVTVHVRWAVAAEAARVAGADVACAVISAPVLITDAASIEIPASVLNTVIALGVIWTVAAVTNIVTFSNEHCAALASPEGIASTGDSVDVNRGMVNTSDTILCSWASTTERAITEIVTRTNED